MNECQVKLIALTRYWDDDGHPESLIEHAGRVCYRSEGDSGNFIQARIAQGHESIIEHASATFEISGISRACSHQLVRHRLANYSQESQRYVDLSDPELVVPPAIAADVEAMAIWNRLTEQMVEAYRGLRELGIHKEDARFLLPNATATRLVVTMNFRELRHFFRVRLQPEAQWEIRQVATKMLGIMQRETPSVFEDISIYLKSSRGRM